MNEEFNGKFLKQKDEIVIKEKSPLLYKKKGNDLIKSDTSRKSKEKPKEQEIIDSSQKQSNTSSLNPLKQSQNFFYGNTKITQLEKEIEAKRRSNAEAIDFNTRLQNKLNYLRESLTDKKGIIEEIVNSITTYEIENKRLNQEIKEKEKEINNLKEKEQEARQHRQEQTELRSVRDMERNLLTILMNIRRLQASQQQHEQQYPNIDNMTYEELLELEEKMGSVSKGLSEEQIKKIKKRYYSKKLYNNDKCIICQFEFKESEGIKVLPCNHCFHNDCIDQWLKNEKHCPYCKKEAI